MRDTEECIKNIVAGSHNITMTEDFHCKEVNWEEWMTAGSVMTWGSNLLIWPWITY